MFSLTPLAVRHERQVLSIKELTKVESNKQVTIVTEITWQKGRTQEYTLWSCRDTLGGRGVVQCPWPPENELGSM